MQPHPTGAHGGPLTLVATAAHHHGYAPPQPPPGSTHQHQSMLGSSLTGHPLGMGGSLTGHPQSPGGSLTNYPHSLSSSLTTHPHSQSAGGSSLTALPQTMGGSQTSHPHFPPPAYAFSVFGSGSSATTQPPSLNSTTTLGGSILGGSVSLNSAAHPSAGQFPMNDSGYSMMSGSGTQGPTKAHPGVVAQGPGPGASGNMTPLEASLHVPTYISRVPYPQHYMNPASNPPPSTDPSSAGPQRFNLAGGSVGFQSLSPSQTGMQFNMPPLTLPSGAPPGGTFILSQNGGVVQYVGPPPPMSQPGPGLGGSLVLPPFLQPPPQPGNPLMHPQLSASPMQLQPREPHPLAGAPLIQTSSASAPQASGASIASKEAINESKIYVRHLSFDISLDELRQFFGQFGAIISISLHRERGGTGHCAYLTYDSVQAATEAIREANGSSYFQELSKRRLQQSGLPPLSVRMAESLTERNDRWARRAATASAGSSGSTGAIGSPTSSILMAPHSPSAPPIAPLQIVPQGQGGGQSPIGQTFAPIATPSSPATGAQNMYFLMVDSNGRPVFPTP